MATGIRRAIVGAVALSVLLPASPAPALSITARPVVTGLEFPAAFTVFPGSVRILYGERFTGEVHVYNLRTGTDRLIFTIPSVAGGEGEQGLLGLALHPDYPNTPRLFAYATRTNANGGRENQILRLTYSGGTRAFGLRVIFRSSPAAPTHNGGRIVFGPDAKLYAVIGDRGDPSTSQDLSAKTGKVVRMNDAGGIPASNPFPNRFAFAFGIRNSYGMAFDPLSGRLWETDNGPTCNDEVNRIDRGRNYGWGPSWTCSTPPQPPVNTNQDGPEPQMPARWYGTPTAPTGIAFCVSCDLNSYGYLFFGEFKTGRIRRAELGPNRAAIASQEIVYTHPRGILSMERAPTGTLYVSDNSGIYRLQLG